MTARKLYCAVTNTSNIISANVTNNHDSPTATAIIETVNTSLSLGDAVIVDMGYTDEHQQMFTGYVKQIERNIPNNTYTITAYDNMIRAQDYFIASSTPESALKYKNITAESLVQSLMALAGLTSFDYTTTYFTFGVKNSFEVNLVSVYDYCRTISSTLTWSLWADQSGTINFKNRKPYVMTGDTGQPGDIADTPTGYTVTDSISLDINYNKSERSLRNRVVVYGNEGVSATASASSPYLPSGFYKTAVLAFPQLIDSNSLAQDIADYNLNLLNRVTESVSANVVGKPSLSARTVITANLSKLGITGNWYVFGCDHSWSQTGYITSLDLRRMST